MVMGDPRFFRIKGGHNPYTRNRWGIRKRVDRTRAIRQWQTLKGTLEALGAKVFVLPAVKDLPGLVFPANAGFLYPKYELRDLSKRTFYLSNLTSHRSREQDIYQSFFSSCGLATARLPYAFEGEADFFPCGEFYIFTYGTIRKTGFRPRWGWPPYSFQYSHRSDERNEEALKRIVGDRQILKVRLTDVRYYHGDTCFFAFGPNREYLFAYLDAIDQESRARLKHNLGSRLISLSHMDAENFVANSVQVDTENGPHLVLPAGVSDEVKTKVSSLGLPFSTVDVSEFFLKGGGSIKCLICDLGPLVQGHDT